MRILSGCSSLLVSNFGGLLCQYMLLRFAKLHLLPKGKLLPHYLATLRMPRSALFETFSINFSGPFPVGLKWEKYLLITVEHLTWWPIARCTKHGTSNVLWEFVQEEIIFTVEPPKAIILDNARCFAPIALQEMMKRHGSLWKTVCGYVPLSNGRA